MMNLEEISDELLRNLRVFESLCTGLSPDEINWKSSSKDWSIKEILCHLLDEERLDFKARFLHVCETPNEPMPGIDPPSWVIEHHYQEADFQSTWQAFLTERLHSVDLLKTIKNVPWEKRYKHPVLGEVSPQYFLENWLAHDLLHQRQILNRRYTYIKQRSSENLNYAGEW